MAATESQKQPDSVASVVKVFTILQMLSAEKSIGITDLSQRIMMSKSTVYRFLQTMKTLGYVAQEEDTEKYSLTLKLFELGASALQHTDLISLANTEMCELAKLTKEAIHLGALDGDSFIYIHKIDAQYTLRMYSRIGRRNPLYSTAIGKVLLAWRESEEVLAIMAAVDYQGSTPRTVSSTQALLPILAHVRQQGFAEDNEEQEEGIRCLAVPVFDRFGAVAAGLSISLPTLRFSEQKAEEYVRLLHAGARRVSAAMGFHHYPF